MKRGILVLTGTELVELTRYVNSEKLLSAARNVKESNRILVSDEELENILDQVGKPDANEILNSAVDKISKALFSLRTPK